MSRKSELQHPGLRVTKGQAGCPPRVITQITGLGPDSHLGIFNGDIDTLSCALLERMYYCKVGDTFLPAPEPDVNHVFAGLRDFRKKLVHRMVSTPYTIEEVVDTYKGRKRTIYQQASESLNNTGLKRGHAISDCFVKVEKGNTSKAPRCIQPRRPEYNLVLGKYIKKIEHRMYRRIAQIYGDGPTVMKGYTVQDVARIMRGKWDSFSDPVAVGLDAVKFDMHVSAAMLEWEHSIYKAVTADTRELNKLLRWQMFNKGRGRCVDGKLTYTVKGKRFSGDMNTALGNCIIMCGLVYTYLKEKGMHGKLVNNGDDCVVFMERGDLKGFVEGLDDWFYSYGFRMTTEDPVFDFEKIEFCQMRPVPGPHGWVMVRNIQAALVKDCLCTIDLDGASARKWMYAVGECGLALTSGIPIMQEFYLALMRNGDKSSNITQSLQFQSSGLRHMRGELDAKVSTISAESRRSVYVAWGITPDEQIALEEHFRNWTFDPTPGDINVSQPPIFHGISLSW